VDANPYLSPSRVKAALRSLDLRPSRDMGQNFLVDAGALATIVAAAELVPGEQVVEVGPGLGVLTWELLRADVRVLAIELDKRLAERLPHEFPGDAGLQVIQQDILRVAPEQLLAAAGHPPYKLVANLPYTITSPLLRHFLESRHPPSLMVVLVQWEVAERIAATAGDMSLLAHSVQAYAVPEIVARVPSTSFVPTPKVDSAVLRLRLRPLPLVPHDQAGALFRTIKAGFLQTRKQLGNGLALGLRSFGTDIGREQVQAALAKAGIDPSRRAETLTFGEWLRVHAALQQRHLGE
jgi:16S rRNA (adenine1518-N6/adenine1519-N6)-dimethyltransferase